MSRIQGMLWIVPALALALAACQAEAPGRGTAGDAEAVSVPALEGLRPIPSPAGPGSAEPDLLGTTDGAYLSWLEPSGDGRHALRVARWNPDGWDSARTVIDRPDLFVNWADFPSVAIMEDGTMAAHWLQKSGPDPYAYDIRMSLSRDGGRSWSDDIVPHRDGVEAEHGFVSLRPVGDGLGVVWLDGRETVEGRPMTLRFTTLSSDGRLGPETVIDPGTCDCCQTAMATTSTGPIVAYRDRSAAEVRDIYVSRRVGGAWSEPRPVHRDGWVIDACPVNGPAIDARGDRVAVAWFTASPDARVLTAFSDDAGASFGPPVRVDDGGAMGRVALELLPDGGGLVTWLERTDDAAEVRVRRVTPDGTGPARRVAGTAAERASGFPRTARLGDLLVFAWTEPGAGGGVRTAVAPIPADEVAASTARGRSSEQDTASPQGSR